MPSEKQRKRRAVEKRDGKKCRTCGATEGLTLDHIVPLARGGNHAIVNLQLLCRPCNSAKGSTLDEQLVIRERLRPDVRKTPWGKAFLRPKLGGVHTRYCDAKYCVDTCPVKLAKESPVA